MTTNMDGTNMDGMHHNMPEEKLEITNTVMSKIDKICSKILEHESEILTLTLENQWYSSMKLIEILCSKKKNICVKHQECKDKNSKKKKTKHEKYESMLNCITTLCTEIDWWQQRFEKSQNELMIMTTEKQKVEKELMKYSKKIIKLQNFYKMFEKQKFDLLLQIKDKNNPSLTELLQNLLTSQKNILQKKKHQQSSEALSEISSEASSEVSSEINDALSNMQNDLKVSEISHFHSHNEDYITLPLVKGGYKHRITVATANPADIEMYKAITESLKRINKILDTDCVKMTKSLKYDDLKTMMINKSPVVKEQVPTKNLNNDYNDFITSPSVILHKEKKCDHIMPSPMIIGDEQSNKVKKSSKDDNINIDTMIDTLGQIIDNIGSKKKTNKTLNKEITKVTESLDDQKTNAKSIIEEEEVQNQDYKIVDNKTETKTDAVDFEKLFDYSKYQTLSSTTKDQIKHMYKAYQSQLSEDNQTFKNCSLFKKLDDACTSQQYDKKQVCLDLEIDANINNKQIEYDCNVIATDILMSKYYDKLIS